jgi:phosphate transport system substrate-binding protein
MKLPLATFLAFATLFVPPASAESTKHLLGNDHPALAFVEELPSYRPEEAVSGKLRIWGHGSFKRDFMGQLLAAWLAEFAKHQPGVAFENRMYGTASAIGALYSGTGDIAILGEEISPAALRAFRRAKGYDPTHVEVANGSVDVNFYDYAHMIFVHRDNPTKGLTLKQLDAIFGEEGKRGGGQVRRWGQLGLGRSWADAAITPYGWRTDVDFGLFFRERVLENSHRWNGAMREYEHSPRPDGTQYDHGQQILDALAADKNGIAISNVRYKHRDVRALPLAWDDKSPFVEASPQTLIDRSYPLVRIIPVYVDVAPGKAMDPARREFLRFLLSREGQRILIEQSGYLPLSAATLRREQGKLK